MSEFEENEYGTYNHISNGGYSFRTYIGENNVQYLEVQLSNYGVTQTTTIMLNAHVIDSLSKTVDQARKIRWDAQLDTGTSYLRDTPRPDGYFSTASDGVADQEYEGEEGQEEYDGSDDFDGNEEVITEADYEEEQEWVNLIMDTFRKEEAAVAARIADNERRHQENLARIAREMENQRKSQEAQKAKKTNDPFSELFDILRPRYQNVTLGNVWKDAGLKFVDNLLSEIEKIHNDTNKKG